VKKYIAGIFLLFFLTACLAFPQISITKTDALSLGKKIQQNEMAQHTGQLINWNNGDDFAVAGVGHFVWYPDGVNGSIFFMLFPQFLEYASHEGVTLPKWLQRFPPCPWSTQKAFMQAQQSEKMIELQKFLENTLDVQTQFMVYSVNQSIPSLLNSIAGQTRAHVEQQLGFLLATKGGVYAIVDYVNFQGLGLYPSERYHNQGWGLLPVLENMSANSSGSSALQAFVGSAKKLLQQRAANAPANRHEADRLPGWLKRVNKYNES
jgi:hypothetical protein